MLARTDADAVRVHNRLAVIESLRRAETATRKELSTATGLSVSAASSIASGLLRARLVMETAEAEEGAGDNPARRGRPGRSLALDGAAARVAIARIAVGEIEVRLCDYRGKVLGSARWDGDIGNFSQAEIVKRLGHLLDAAGAACARGASGASNTVDVEAGGIRPVSRIVVAVQGKTDSAGQRIVWSPALRHRDLEIAAPLAALSGAAVGVFNDCSLLPEAFRWSADFRGRDVAILFIGFGVGMGLRLRGETFQGQRSSAVEFGHINHMPGGAPCRCGNRGCIEAYAADYAIWRKASGRPDEIPTHRITDAEIARLAGLARGGDAAAAQAFAEAGAAIGYGLGRLFTLVDPLPIVITGAGVHAMDLLEPAIRAAIAESAIDGDGADVDFSLIEDVDELIFKAATARALGAVDVEFARADGNAEAAIGQASAASEREKAA